MCSSSCNNCASSTLVSVGLLLAHTQKIIIVYSSHFINLLGSSLLKKGIIVFQRGVPCFLMLRFIHPLSSVSQLISIDGCSFVNMRHGNKQATFKHQLTRQTTSSRAGHSLSHMYKSHTLFCSSIGRFDVFKGFLLCVMRLLL